MRFCAFFESAAFFSTSPVLDPLPVVCLLGVILPTRLAVRVWLGSADMAWNELPFELILEGCGLGIRTTSPEERSSGDPRSGGALPASSGDPSVFPSHNLFKRRYADGERAWTHQWEREVEAVVVVVAVHVLE